MHEAAALADEAPAALAARAKALRRQGRAAEALALCQQWRDLAPTDARVLFELALAARDLGQIGAAEAALEAALAQAPDLAAAHTELGLLRYRAGRPAAALGPFRRALELQPTRPEWHANLGAALRAVGRVEAAIEAYRAGLGPAPAHVGLLADLGKLLLAKGRLLEAEPCLEQAAAQAPTEPDKLDALALLYLLQGRTAERRAVLARRRALTPDRAPVELAPRLAAAEAALDAGKPAKAARLAREVLGAAPETPAALRVVAIALRRQDRPAESLVLCRRWRELAPADVGAHHNLALAARALGALDEAAAVLAEAVARQPSFQPAHAELGIVAFTGGQIEAAAGHFRRALDLDPADADVAGNLGMALYRLGQVDAAIEAFMQGLAQRPEHAGLHVALGSALFHKAQIAAAEEQFQAAALLAPADSAMPYWLGIARLKQGRPAEACAAFARAVALAPDDFEANREFVFAHNYRDDVSQLEVKAAHVAWARRLARGIVRRAGHPNPPDPERRLRVGYVSADFRYHSLGWFFTALAAHHDPAAVEVFAYADIANPDEVTARLREMMAHWRDVRGLDDAAIARLVEVDAIDILVDLQGITDHSRIFPCLFAAKPAPVQVAWLGYPNTTGLATIDWRIVDGITDPPGADAWHTERLHRLEAPFLCYEPPVTAPMVVPPPSRKAGTITFGSFNSTIKAGFGAAELWSRILTAVADPRAREAYLERFTRHGISPARIIGSGQVATTEEHLALYGEIDVALDPFPYNGTTTTCEALWMGVPVVTLLGDRHAARVGASLLSAVGLPELVAESPEAYVAIAVALAGDCERLASLRASLRERMAASPLMDAASFARRIEAAYRAMWRDWCRMPRD